MKVCKTNARLFVFLILLIIFLIGLLFYSNKINIFVESPGSVQKISQTNQNQSKEIKTKIIRVVDGDTVIVKYKGDDERVRLVGLNTPEARAVNGRVVECFGKEASAKAKEVLLPGQEVIFEYDTSQSKRDKYGRLLGYIFFADGQNFAKKMIRDGYGYEYTYHGRAYKYQKEFKEAQKYAQEHKIGL